MAEDCRGKGKAMRLLWKTKSSLAELKLQVCMGLSGRVLGSGKVFLATGSALLMCSVAGVVR